MRRTRAGEASAGFWDAGRLTAEEGLSSPGSRTKAYFASNRGSGGVLPIDLPDVHLIRRRT
jgi:hypothetical protein